MGGASTSRMGSTARGMTSSIPRASAAGPSSWTWRRKAACGSIPTSSSISPTSVRTRSACRAATPPRTRTVTRMATAASPRRLVEEYEMTTLWPWITLALLGAYHGLNPGMGWLFAVALGLQEQSRAAVIRAFGPIALGHAASVALVVGLVGAAQLWIAPEQLHLLGAGAVMIFGLYKLLLPLSHPRWVGMRVGARDLTAWSFLMATAHGAGLMLVPVLLRLPSGAASHAGHASHPHHASHAEHVVMMSAAAATTATELAAVGVHTAAMFLVMVVIAVVVFEKVGLAILRRAWFNLDRAWAGAMIG